MYKFKCLISFLVFFVSSPLFAQDKYEKESRIKPEEVPLNARLFIDSLHLNAKVKWYKEEGLNRKSIEGKFKCNRVRYSIEFDTLGKIEDIEIDVNWEYIKSNLRDTITTRIKQNCSKHRIVKVQKQFTGSENYLFALLKTGNGIEQLTVNYELIVRCMHQSKVDLFEYLFNDQGKLLSKSKIIFKNSSHLEY